MSSPVPTSNELSLLPMSYVCLAPSPSSSFLPFFSSSLAALHFMLYYYYQIHLLVKIEARGKRRRRSWTTARACQGLFQLNLSQRLSEAAFSPSLFPLQYNKQKWWETGMRTPFLFPITHRASGVRKDGGGVGGPQPELVLLRERDAGLWLRLPADVLLPGRVEQRRDGHLKWREGRRKLASVRVTVEVKEKKLPIK